MKLKVDSLKEFVKDIDYPMQGTLHSNEKQPYFSQEIADSIIPFYLKKVYSKTFPDFYKILSYGCLQDRTYGFYLGIPYGKVDAIDEVCKEKDGFFQNELNERQEKFTRFKHMQEEKVEGLKREQNEIIAILRHRRDEKFKQFEYLQNEEAIMLKRMQNALAKLRYMQTGKEVTKLENIRKKEIARLELVQKAKVAKLENIRKTEIAKFELIQKKEIEEFENEKYDIKSRIERCEGEIKYCNSRIDFYKISENKIAKDDKERAIGSYKKGITSSEKRIATFQKIYDDIQKEIETTIKKQTDIQKKIYDDIQKEIEATIKKQTDIQKKIYNDIQKDIDDIPKKQADIQKEIDDIQKDIDDIPKKQADIQKEIDDIQKEIDDIPKKQADIQKEIDDIQDALRKQRREIDIFLSRSIEQYRKSVSEKYKKIADKFESAQQGKIDKAQKYKCAYAENNAVAEFLCFILQDSFYPFEFECNPAIEYNGENKLLVVDYYLPTIDDTPNIKEIKEYKTKSSEEKYLSKTELNRLYDELIYKIIIRSIAEIFHFDDLKKVDTVCFNGRLKTRNKATGQLMDNCILSVQVNRQEFEAIDLNYVDCKACFKHFKGVSGAKLHDQSPIVPLIQLDKTDKRFVESHTVETNDSTNLATMDWEEFEHLVRELFDLEFNVNGGEVKITQASRDGGVDAVAFDPDPIRGGKIVIQAKRYTNTVGVSAVRDLYGTVINEGANKGILITTSDYGVDSYNFAKGKPLTLLNGGHLLFLLEKHNKKARIDLKEAKGISG